MNEMMESLMKLHRCEDCQIRCQAAKKPRSIFARIHRWHTRWWPGWRIYLAEERAKKAGAHA
jgi:hypothetical protein